LYYKNKKIVSSIVFLYKKREMGCGDSKSDEKQPTSGEDKPL